MKGVSESIEFKAFEKLDPKEELPKPPELIFDLSDALNLASKGVEKGCVSLFSSSSLSSSEDGKGDVGLAWFKLLNAGFGSVELDTRGDEPNAGFPNTDPESVVSLEAVPNADVPKEGLPKAELGVDGSANTFSESDEGLPNEGVPKEGLPKEGLPKAEPELDG